MLIFTPRIAYLDIRVIFWYCISSPILLIGYTIVTCGLLFCGLFTIGNTDPKCHLLQIVSWHRLRISFNHASCNLYISYFKYCKNSNISYSIGPWVPTKAFARVKLIYTVKCLSYLAQYSILTLKG